MASPRALDYLQDMLAHSVRWRNLLATIVLSAWTRMGRDPRKRALCVFISSVWHVRVTFWQNNWEIQPLLLMLLRHWRDLGGTQLRQQEPCLLSVSGRSTLRESPCWFLNLKLPCHTEVGLLISHMCQLQWKRMRWEYLTKSAQDISEDAISVTRLMLLNSWLPCRCAGRHFDPE